MLVIRRRSIAADRPRSQPFRVTTVRLGWLTGWVADPRLIRPALEAARKALRLLDEEHVPIGLRRVVAASGRRLPAPLEKTLIDHLERLDWLRAEAVGHLDDRHTASRLFLERPDGWEETAAGLEAEHNDAAAERLLESTEAANARLAARLAARTEELRVARAEIERLRVESRSDPERARLAEVNRDLRARIAEAERALAAESRRCEDVERLLGEADRRIAELRRRSRAGQRQAAAPGGPQVFGGGDPLALARSLDHLVETLAGRRGTEPLDSGAGPGEESLVLPQGVRPDQAEAVEWAVSLVRPVTVLIDGYNVGHELAPVPDSGVQVEGGADGRPAAADGGSPDDGGGLLGLAHRHRRVAVLGRGRSVRAVGR
jgi:hypothetical protein